MKERIFEHVKPARREFLRKLLAGAAFASPVIATFSVEALMPDPAYAVSNTSFCIKPNILAPGPAPVVPACSVFACAPPPTPVPVQPAVPPSIPICGGENR